MAGEVTGIGLKSEENFKRHLYHFSKENIASLPSSYILPKDSPLEVGAYPKRTNWVRNCLGKD